MDKPIPNDPVAGLIDIPLPMPISLWPTTLTSRIVIALLVAAAFLSIWRFAKHWHANRYRRAALAELEQILRSADAGPAPPGAALALLVRRTALAAFPRDKIAPLAGPAWLAFLDKSYGGHEFSNGVGRALETAPYARPSDAENVTPLAELVRRWIRSHYA
ncbi:MAG TPA: DUF4381 domain-containing protein [Pseudolabrys sp.]|jgi:Ca-activated chloride channel family protein|nr:DUF4381 domain-containing protein [Pseudolabrys sp.]